MWQQEQAGRCPGCGVWPYETDENPDKYVARETHCVTCAQLESGRERMRDNPLKGMHMHLRLSDG